MTTTTQAPAPNYISSGQQRVLATLLALFGYEFSGVSTKELATRLTVSSAQAYKDLINLQEAGLAEQLPDKNWRISAQLGRESIKILNSIDADRRRIEETARRYGISN